MAKTKLTVDLEFVMTTSQNVIDEAGADISEIECRAEDYGAIAKVISAYAASLREMESL